MPDASIACTTGSTLVPRAGLSSQDVVAAAAELADEAGYQQLSMGLVAQRLGIRTPSLYRHVGDRR